MFYQLKIYKYNLNYNNDYMEIIPHFAHFFFKKFLSKRIIIDI